MTSITIRRCDPAKDAAILAPLGAETFSDAFGHLYKEEDLAAFLEESHAPTSYQELLDDPKMALWVAEKDGEAVGYVIAGPCHLPAPDVRENDGELLRLYIRKEAQGAGVGRMLLETALDWLEQNFDDLYIGVWSENFGAQRLYARYGFAKVHEYDFMVGDQADLEFIFKRKTD